MAVSVTEHVKSRTITGEAGRPTSAELLFTVSGTAHHGEAYLELYNSTDLQFDDLNRQTVQIEQVSIDENNPDKSLWRGTVNYDQNPLPEDKYLIPKFSFDTGGGTQHISQSLRPVWRSADAPNFKGAIGVSDNNVSGVDIVVPNLNLTITQTFPREMVTIGYMADLAYLTGKVNGGWFLGFAPGEVLFMGAGGSDSTIDIDVTFKFAICGSRRDFYVGDIYVPAKYGWEYMWVRYADEVASDGGSIVKVPSAVYIEQVYETANFLALGINV